MKTLKNLFYCLLWALLGVAVVFIYLYDERLYSVLIIAFIIGVTIHYWKDTRNLYIEVFNETGITAYFQKIRKSINVPFHINPNLLYKNFSSFIGKLGLW